jgi:two-component system nitrogen regulation sensor histidine kinase GlnL
LEEFRLQSKSTADSCPPRDFFIQSNGSVRTLRGLCQPLRSHDQAEIGNVLQLRDVTEQQLIEQRMRQMERYMGLGSLAAGLHHEIKNPLAALSLHAQLLEEELAAARTSDDVKEMLGVIKSELNRVGGVLENFRDFASLDQMNLNEVNLGELIHRQVKLITPRAEAEGIQVNVHLPDDVGLKLTVDRVRLEQVLLNLFVNAIEAMPAGGALEIRAARVAMGKAAGNGVRIQVVDHGVGIPENLKGNVFDPYFTTKHEGTGMGLAVCDKIVRQHHGTLEFHSSSEGTVFELTLPLK